MQARRHALVVVLLVMVTGCSSPTDPGNNATTNEQLGRLAGVVSIGPNCPGPTTTNPCPTPPEAYRLRKILVYNEAKSILLHVVDIDSQGLYFIDLPAPAKYTIDLRTGSAIDHSNLPQTVEVLPNSVTTVNVSIDTGIR